MRPAISREDAYMEATAAYGFFAERYHWTPRQVLTECPEWFIQRLPAFAGIVDEIHEERAKAASKQ